tara:strand:+ start:509 stop:751 length:243 start_codon:yes stop_codon:yes gene_type:complete
MTEQKEPGLAWLNTSAELSLESQLTVNMYHREVDTCQDMQALKDVTKATVTQWIRTTHLLSDAVARIAELESYMIKAKIF